MAYLPPHKRISDSCRPRSAMAPPFPSTAAAAASSSQYSSSPSGRKSHLPRPDVSIHRSRDYIGRFIIVLPDNAPGSQQLDFVPFDGESFPHLRDVPLYALQLSGGDEGSSKGSLGLDEDLAARLTLHEHTTPAKSIIERLRTDLEKTSENLKINISQGSRVVPLIRLKFGRLLFHGNMEVATPSYRKHWKLLFDWSQTYTSESLEEKFRSHYFCKVFDNSLSDEEYRQLLVFANLNVEKTWSKEKYEIKVADEVSNSELCCICIPTSSSDENCCSPQKHGQPGALEMRKVRKDPVRYFVGDVACVGKAKDIRVMFYVKEYLHMDLTQEELQDLESCFSNVRVNNNVKGGLHWMAGTSSSTSGRFKVVSCHHELVTYVIGGGLKWRFQKCNRGEFKAASGRVTHEVTVNPAVFSVFRKGTREWSTDELLLSLENSLQDTWMQCV